MGEILMKSILRLYVVLFAYDQVKAQAYPNMYVSNHFTIHKCSIGNQQNG